MSATRPEDITAQVVASFAGAPDARLGEIMRSLVRHLHAFVSDVGLTECIGCGCLSLDRCRLGNPGERAAAPGPGPRYWIGDDPRS